MADREERALLIEAANMVRIGLAKELLAEAGIPFVVMGPDFDVAELGQAAHDMLRGSDLYVPRSRFDEARAVLHGAWEGGEVELDDDFDVGPFVEEEPVEAQPRTVGFSGPAVFLLLIAGLLLALYLRGVFLAVD